MDAKTGFDAAMLRARHLLKLYDLLFDTRQRAVRSSWKKRFVEFMKWPKGENIVRIDGLDGESMLILRESVGINRSHFTDEYLSELLRSALVASVSALDRYMHDVILDRSWALLGKPEAEIPAKLKELKLGVLVTGKALKKLRSDPSARPGSLVKAAIQNELHLQTFQGTKDVERAMLMIGVRKLWSQVRPHIPGQPSAGDIQAELNRIVRRRNQIVHEADLVRQTRARGFVARDVDPIEAKDMVEWIDQFVAGVDQVVKATP